MGRVMEIRNTGAVMDKVARDGRPFAHITENLRDCLLAGAKNVEFRIHGLKLDTPSVARRVIADDGLGMSRSTLEGAYSSFGESATTNDFDVVLDTKTGDVKATIVPVGLNHGGLHHSRNGMGGRGTLLSWNPLGVVTISFHGGEARMVWMYRSIDGTLMMRYWVDDNGTRVSSIEPYAEGDLLTKEDLIADRDFSRMLLVRSGFAATEEAADEYIAAMDAEDTIANPFADVSWDGDVVPEWLVADYDADGLARRADGTLAHGTVKYLLGDSPTSHTAVTGDPYFLQEREYTKYNGAGNKFWLDLLPWNVKIWTVVADGSASKRWFDLVGEPKKYRVSDGSSLGDSKVPHGRKQLGALSFRTQPIDGNDPVQLKSVLDLGDYGHAVIVVRKAVEKDGKQTQGTTSEEWWGTTRRSVIGVVYGNEVHGLKDATEDTKNYQFRAMGIQPGMGLEGRISVFLFLPRATDDTPGIFQSMARDGLKWSGREGLPIPEINDAVRLAIGEQAPELVALFNAAAKDPAGKIKRDLSKVKNLFKASNDLVKAGKRMLKGEEEDALISDPKGSETGTPVGPQGNPGPTPRDPCPECGLRIHAADCSRKPVTTGGGGGGGGGDNQRLTPDKKGKTKGRSSRAKAKGAGGLEPDAPKPPEPPTVEFQDRAPDSDDPDFPVTYGLPSGDWLPDTGTLTVNREHAAIQRLYGLTEKLGRDSDESQKLTENWIEAQLQDVVLGALSLYGQKLVDGSPTRKSLSEISEYLLKSDLWFVTVAGLLMESDSLTSYVAGNASKSRTTGRKPSRTATAAAATAAAADMAEILDTPEIVEALEKAAATPGAADTVARVLEAIRAKNEGVTAA